MDIRSVTLFMEPDFLLAAAAPWLTAVRTAFPYPVQTVRLATTPFPDWWDGRSETIQEYAARWAPLGIDYISLGPVQLRHSAEWIERLPELLSLSDQIFASAEIADIAGQIDVGRCHQVADAVLQISTILENGFGNLYLTALANCPPGSPFFPVAYHHGGPPSFAIAVESADLALKAIQTAETLSEARANLVEAIEGAAQQVMETAVSLARQYGIPCNGIDFSLAPFPTDDKSIGGALEALGVPQLGGSGSLFAAAFITEAIERAQFTRCGFSGLMLPVLEDSVLATRAAEGALSVTDLLSYSAVCGVGLDTIPLPGDVERDSLTAVLLDVAALATRLNKPLTARLMPLPGLKAGDPVQFDFPYFADSRVMPLKGRGVTGLLAQGGRLALQTRKPN